MEAERQIVVRADKFGSVERARLQCLENFASCHVGNRCAQFLPNTATEARCTETYPLKVFDTC